MIFSLALLSAGIVSTPVFISEVKAAREAGHLRVEVRGDGGIDPEMARTMIDDGRLFIYLTGTRVKADNRAWDLEDGSGEIRAHRHRTETELVVPLDGNGCTGPVELAGSPSGITALVGCDGTVAAPKARIRARDEEHRRPTPTPAISAVQVDNAGTAGNIERPAEIPSQPDKSSDVQRIRALVALSAPAEKVAMAPPTPAAVLALAPPAKQQPELRVAPVIGSVPAPVSDVAPRGRAATAKVDVAASAGPGIVVAAAIPGTVGSTAGSTGGGLRMVAVPALLLLALATAAYLFARRRRIFVDRQIQIIETASLGPKRSLIVARVGDETLILGTSEAGITLLKSSSTTATAASILAVSDPAADSALELSQPIEEALADIPEPGPDRPMPGRNFRTIAGGLGGLFAGRAVDGGNHTQNQDDTSDGFDDLLEDSVEDQELRQKLAAGMSARVR